jgi:hypothetical protein
MGSGKGPGFPKPQKAWIKRLIPEFLKKTQYGKPLILGQLLPTDDADKYTWVEARQTEFEKVFADELKATLDSVDDNGKLIEGPTSEAWSSMWSISGANT